MESVMIIRALVVFACVCAASAATLRILETMAEEWNGFKTKYSKIYDSEYVERMRFSVYLDNRQKIAKHNHKYELGLVTFTMAMNRFGDMTVSEFTRRMNGFNRTGTAQPHVSENSEAALFLAPANVELPSEIDWRKLGAVTPIKDQGECGSCWAFSATGALEGQHFRRNGTLVSLSEQNLVDCSGRYGNEGCEGGLMDQAFQYVRANRGIDDETSYPYEAHDESCHYDPRHSAATDAGYVDLPSGNEAKLQAAVATVGPISVAIDADHDSFMFYKSGVFYEPDCSSIYLDHGVLAIGYGADQQTGRPYWLVKNSWGKDWGEQGYVRMSRNRHNNCGIASMASYPLVK